MHTPPGLDATDRRLLLALDDDPRATVQWLALHLGLARGTVHARLQRLADGHLLQTHSVRVRPAAAGHPLRAFVTAEVDQGEFDGMVADLRTVPEVIECSGVAGTSDLLIEIAARDADDVYVVTQRIMGCRGIRRTATMIVLRELIGRRHAQLLRPPQG